MFAQGHRYFMRFEVILQSRVNVCVAACEETFLQRDRGNNGRSQLRSLVSPVDTLALRRNEHRAENLAEQESRHLLR